ncbi:MAG TPA: ABC transporter ATP-binding protein [Methylomirabilota bacterium]|nr:ABC transporter ATP-binding protein [Methylomirabilota bacterium]
MSRILLRDLVKTFGGLTAVAGVNLEVRDGEFVVFVGPSGCGKTTTLNMISGLETPTGGEVVIGDRVVNDVEPGERDLGMVFQDLALFPHMTVFENIAFGLRVKRVAADEIRRRVQEAAATMRIAPLLDKKPAQCSGGEAQRVALARTIVTKPSVFLMDEPLSSLDAKLRVEMRTELKRLHGTLRATFVYVTHDQAEAMTMADRIVVMDRGLVQQVGPPLTVYGDPANRFVAGFFGVPAMNFIDGALAVHGNTLRFDAAGGALDLGRREPAGAGAVTLGIRPEHVRLLPDGEGWPAAVSLIEPMGDETLVFLDYGGRTSIVAKVDAEDKVAVGDQRRFGFRPDKLVFFDAATGERVLR